MKSSQQVHRVHNEMIPLIIQLLFGLRLYFTDFLNQSLRIFYQCQSQVHYDDYELYI